MLHAFYNFFFCFYNFLTQTLKIVTKNGMENKANAVVKRDNFFCQLIDRKMTED